MKIKRVSTTSTQSAIVKSQEEANKLLLEWDREYEDIVNCEHTVEGTSVVSTDAVKFNGKWYITVTKMSNGQF